MSQQGTADKRKHITLIIPQKSEIRRRLESCKSQREVMTHTTLDCQLSMVYRNRKTNYDNLWHQVKV
jgi:hypothetical protein